MDEHTTQGELNYGIITARADFYRYSFECDRFDGTDQNFDVARGRELALRDLARRLKIEVVNEEKTKISGLLTWEHQLVEAGEQQTDAMKEYIVAVRTDQYIF